MLSMHINIEFVLLEIGLSWDTEIALLIYLRLSFIEFNLSNYEGSSKLCK